MDSLETKNTLIVLSVVAFGVFDVLDIANIQTLSGIPKPRYRTTSDSKQIFVANRDREGLSKKLSEIQIGGQESSRYTISNGDTHSTESRQGRFNKRPEVRHIAFLKVHKAASTTVQTILFRFGYRRNLTFVLPKDEHYFSKSTTSHKPLIPPTQKGHYDILCLHGYFNYSIYASVLPKDTVYVAIVRDPWSQFVSAFNYYSYYYHFRYLENIPPNKLENLIKYPNLYEAGSLSYTMNSMAKDLGFTLKHYEEVSSRGKSESTKAYLDQLGSILEFVLIKEHLDESLIMLQRRLGWSLKDILYVSKNVISKEVQVSQDIMDKFRKRNKLDYIVYNYFLKKFEEEMKRYGDTLQEETDNFRKVLVKVQDWCYDQYFGEMVVDATVWNKQFTVTSLDCRLMAKPELEFIKLLKGGDSTP